MLCLYFSRYGSRIGGQNGERRRKTTQAMSLDKKRVVQSFQTSTHSTKVQVPFAMTAQIQHQQCIPTTVQTTGQRVHQVWGTLRYNREATALDTTRLAKYPHLVQYHRQLQALWVHFQLQYQAITVRRHRMVSVLPALRTFPVDIRQLMATRNKALCIWRVKVLPCTILIIRKEIHTVHTLMGWPKSQLIFRRTKWLSNLHKHLNTKSTRKA